MPPIYREPAGGKCKTLFFISSLDGGGAERVMVDLVRHIDRGRVEPSLVLLYPYEESPYKNDLPDDLRIIVVERKSDHVFHQLKQFVAFLKTVFRENPRVILSMLTHNNIMALVAGVFLGIEVIVCEHNTLGEVIKTREGRTMLGLPVAPVVKIFYRFVNKVIAVSEGIRLNLIEDFGIPAEKVRTIYNPIDLDRIQASSSLQPGHPFFENQKPIVIAMGRLVEQKGFDTLIKAFRYVVQEIDARLIIMGEGPQRGVLENVIEKCGIAGKVSLPGFQGNPYALLSSSDVFVLSSNYEGLPMAIFEAMACGVPVIATDCRSGPREILSNGTCGMLVPVGDEIALAQGIKRLLKDDEMRKKLSGSGKERLKDFSFEKIMKQYEHVIDEARGHRSCY
jgi:glycosyltransferase involved in cell wall biosynthesis